MEREYGELPHGSVKVLWTDVIHLSFDKEVGNKYSHERVLQWYVWYNPTNSKLVLRLVGGPTGWEEVYVEDFVTRYLEHEAWLACMGLPNLWAKCLMSVQEKERILQEIEAAGLIKLPVED